MRLSRKCLFFALFIYCISLSHAQAPDTLWTRTYGGADIDWGYSVQQTTDDGYIITGYTWSFGNGADVYLIKTDANGDTLWTKTYGGTDEDFGNSIQQTWDGGYIIAGYTWSFGAGRSDVYLVKTGTNGETLWTRTYGGTGWDECESIQQTSDSGFILAGCTNSFGGGGHDIYLLKTDADGDTLWTHTYGDTGTERSYQVQQTIDGGYVLVGYTESFGNVADVYLIKTDKNGDTLWTNRFGGTTLDIGYSIWQTSDGAYIITGFTYSFGAGESDVYLIKTNEDGDTLWTRTYGGAGRDHGQAVEETSDGGYIVAGWTTSFGSGSSDVYLIKTTAYGDTLWTTTNGGSSGDHGFSIQQTTDGGYIIAGCTHSFGAGWSDVYLIKTEPDTLGIKEEDVSSIKSNDFCTTILTGPLLLPEDKRCRIFDITGRVIMPDKMRPGIYFIEIDGIITTKVVKIR